MTLQPLPDVTGDTRAFWEGGAEGELLIHRCSECETWFHPPAPVCPACLSRSVGPQPASGRATVISFSANHQPWAPGMEVPYVVAFVGIEEDPDVHLTTRLVDVEPDEIAIGMAVEVVFEEVSDGIHLPLFRPVDGGGR